MIEFRDILYGKIELPDWIGPFLKLPEFLRLRGVRLSNIDSIQFKDFNGPMRWEHSIAVAYLAQEYAKIRKLNRKDTIILTLGSLLHDVATPPFAHTLEYVLEQFDHEFESRRLLSSCRSENFQPEMPVYMSQLPQFTNAINKLNIAEQIDINPDDIADVVVGEGLLGHIVHGAIDLDNIDNVIRASVFLGSDIDRQLPIKIIEWLAKQEHMLVGLQTIESPEVKLWLQYRNALYAEFYNANEEEIARQAFLQHILRRAIGSDFPRQSLIWNTDDSLLSDLADYEEPKEIQYRESLSALVSRYRLLEKPTQIARIDIDDKDFDIFGMLRNPKAVSWIEDKMSTPSFEVMITINIKRFTGNATGKDLFPLPSAYLSVFKLGQDIKYDDLPEWLKKEIPASVQRKNICEDIAKVVRKALIEWEKERSWNKMTPSRKSNIVSNLKFNGNWSFRLTRNDNMHEYPSTFVYAIPANFINSLGLQGELVLDPFGGTGQTAVEAIKRGCKAITSDVNTFACLCARAKLTYLSPEKRERLRRISKDKLLDYEELEPPKVDNIEKWFHTNTLKELCRIWKYVKHQRDETVRQFLTVSFSAILTSCTARKGKHHTYFADNTPLPGGLNVPPYEDAANIFISKIKNNIDVLERFYATLEKDGRDPQKELETVRIFQQSAITAMPEDYGVKPNSVAAIITSPPYLCMADYTFGLRLSYNWIYPNNLARDYSQEIGPRRERKKISIAEKYFSDMDKFAMNASKIIKPNGYLALVFGAPTARAFESINVYKKFDTILEKAGFNTIWKQDRSLHNQRGISCIEKERVSVHTLTK